MIAFAGDALICFFAPIPEDNNDLGQCCLRAINCGNQLKLLQTNNLSAHIAIDFGCARLAFVGGYENMWTHIFDGDCFAYLSSCVNDAQLQELVISSAVVKEIEHCSPEECCNFELKKLPSNNYLVNIVKKEDEFLISCDLDEKFMKSLMVERLRSESFKTYNPQLLSFIPQPISINIQQSVAASTSIENIGSSSELRQVTCIFMKLDSYIGEFPLEHLQNCFYNWQKIIVTLGGFIRQFVVDDKGCVLIALWGVPTATHVNNTMRALLAVSDILLFCKNNNYRVSIGVTTGDCYCGMIGSKSRCDYAAVGSSINFSARLMAKANGKVLIDEETNYHLESSSTDCSLKLTPMYFKGRTEPIQVYQFLENKFRAKSGSTHTLSTNQFLVDSELLSIDSPLMTSFQLNADDSASFSDIENKLKSPRQTFLNSDILEKLSNCINTLNDWHGLVHVVEELPPEDLFEGSFLQEQHSQHLQQQQPIQSNYIQIIHVSGATGTGKTEVANQMFHLCKSQDIQSIFIALCENDLKLDYFVIRQIFMKLIGVRNYDDITKQKNIITDLFFQTYPTNNSIRYLQQKFESIKEILGLTWTPTELTAKSLFSVASFCKKKEDLFRSKSFLFSTSKSNISSTSISANEEYYSHDSLTTFLEFFVTLLSTSPLTIIIDECQYCDHSSWSIIFYMMKHLRAPLIMLFTITTPSKIDSSNNNIIETSYDSYDFAYEKNSVPFLNTQLTLSDAQSKIEKYVERSISSMDPFTSGSPIHVSQRNQLLEALRYYSNITTIKLTGLNKNQVRSILQKYVKYENVTRPLINIVFQICEGNAYWCKIIAEFILQYGEESFCNTFCCSRFDENKLSLSRLTLSSSTPSSPNRSDYLFSPQRSSSDLKSSTSNSYTTPRKLDSKLSSNDEDYGNNSSTSPISHIFLNRFDPDDVDDDDLNDSSARRISITSKEQMSSQSNNSILFTADEKPDFDKQIEKESYKQVDQKLKIQCSSGSINSNSVNKTTKNQYKDDSTASPNIAVDTILYHLITTLMDRLTFYEKEVLKYASVCGAKFNSELLRLIIPTSLIEQFDYILLSLKRYKFITSLHGTMNYAFVSSRIRDVVYSLIPCSDASRIHYLVGKKIEVLYCDNLESFYEVLTFHYTLASMHVIQMTKEEIREDQELANPPVQVPSTPNHNSRSEDKNFKTTTQLTHQLSTQISNSSSNTSRSVAIQPMQSTIRQTHSNYILTVNEIAKKKSYQYAYLTSKLLFTLKEYSKSMDYLRYALQEDTLLLFGSEYYKGIHRYLKMWTHLCEETCSSNAGAVSSQRVNVYSRGHYNMGEFNETIKDMMRRVEENMM